MNFYMPPDKSIKSFIANLIRYNLSFMDFTGVEAGKILNSSFLFLKTFLFGIFRLIENQGLIYADINLLNTKIHENYATYGPIGFLVFIPLLLRSGLKGVFSKSNKFRTIALLALIPLIFIPFLSMLLGFNYVEHEIFCYCNGSKFSIVCVKLYVQVKTDENNCIYNCCCLFYKYFSFEFIGVLYYL